MHTSPCFSDIYRNGNNFCEFLFTSLGNIRSILKFVKDSRDLLPLLQTVKAVVLSYGVKFSPYSAKQKLQQITLCFFTFIFLGK